MTRIDGKNIEQLLKPVDRPVGVTQEEVDSAADEMAETVRRRAVAAGEGVVGLPPNPPKRKVRDLLSRHLDFWGL